jgi:putative acetyltransferase
VRKVRSPAELDQVKELVKEYLKSIPYDLSFQDVENELADMPGKYVPEKEGELLLAYINNEPAGCVAFRKMDE